MSCTSGLEEHNWAVWETVSEQQREQTLWWYRRECQNLGCGCIEEAEGLVPDGPTKLTEAYYDRSGKRVEGTYREERKEKVAEALLASVATVERWDAEDARAVVPASNRPPPSPFPPDFFAGGGVEKGTPLPPSVSGARVPGARCNDPSCGETSCSCTHAGCECYPSPTPGSGAEAGSEGQPEASEGTPEERLRAISEGLDTLEARLQTVNATTAEGLRGEVERLVREALEELGLALPR